MRGNPIKEWIVFSALWLLLLVPVFRLTVFRKSNTIPVRPEHGDTATNAIVSATALFHYTGSPEFIQIIQDERTLCCLTNPSPEEAEQTISILIDSNTAEFILKAGWPDEDRHVLEIGMIVDNKEEKKKHLWAEKTLDEVVSFSW